MKEFKVYELYNELGNIVYVGCTNRTLNRRLNEHTKRDPKKCKNKHGKFYGQELTMNVVRTFPEDKVDVAHYYEAYLKYMWGLADEIKPERSTHSARVKGGKTAGKIAGKIYGKIYGKLNGKKAVETGQIYTLSEERSKPVLVYDKNTNKFIAEYESQSEAARQLQCRQSNISMCLTGKRKSAGGYIFKRKK